MKQSTEDLSKHTVALQDCILSKIVAKSDLVSTQTF